MERLTKWNESLGRYALKDGCLRGTLGKLNHALGKYEDLEEMLQGTFGECDGLLENAVNLLIKHGKDALDTKPFKARLLTDEDVDKWQQYKDAQKKQRLFLLPCNVMDSVYRINMGAKNPIIEMKVCQISYIRLPVFKTSEVYRNIVRIDCIGAVDLVESCYFIEDIGKRVFMDLESAKARVEEMRNEK